MKFKCQVCQCEYDTLEFEERTYGLTRGSAEDRCDQCDSKLQMPSEPITLNQTGVDRLMAQAQVKEASDAFLNALFVTSQVSRDGILLEEVIAEMKRRRTR
jgi:hypothetical protein